MIKNDILIKLKLNKILIGRCCSSHVPREIAPAYKPHLVETNKHLRWIEERKLANFNEGSPKFTMILPPPNITGSLHLGHTLMCTVQDVICRWKQQQGFNVTWVPGTDHAGIATQIVVEKKLLKERNLSRHQMGREKFLQEVWQWKSDKGSYIVNDLKKIGCILNWEQEYFTMDERQEKAVIEAFVYLFDQGLIKREKSLVNWCCTLESAISDIEVETKEIDGPTSISVPGHQKNVLFGQLYDIAYKIENYDEEIVVSTTRPETILGDVAVAIHPSDERYRKFYNQHVKLWHPFRNERIPLIFDESINREFGTGAMKVTPAHDKNDFEIAKRHKIPIDVQVFNDKGQINENFKVFANLPRFEAREKILNVLSELGLFKQVKSHKMNLPLCSRSQDVIEYMLRPQWFLSCHQMAKEAREAVRTEKIKIFPSNFENEWFHWLEETKEWCISRQLWWGHRIPAYLVKNETQEQWIAARSEAEAIQIAVVKFGMVKESIDIQRDADVLDTWFSSSLLPFSVFNWPNNAYKKNYPLDLIETGHDILFFWVARMVMLGLKLTGEVPFKNILLHGIVCDAHGKKMSKSLGNTVSSEQVIFGANFEKLKSEIENNHKTGILNSMELKKSLAGLKKNFPNGIAECGTDALRFTLCSHNIKNHFINFDVAECITNKLFLNKIWQATRYTLGAFEKLQLHSSSIKLSGLKLGLMDRWILSRLANTQNICGKSFENYNLFLATNAIKTFFYTNFCDVYLETTKYGISRNSKTALVHCSVLAICLSVGLQTMSPFTPFISEELLKYFPKFDEIIDSKFLDFKLEAEISEILDVCASVRQFKSQNKISRKHEPKLHLFAQSQEALQLLELYHNEIATLTLCNDLFIDDFNLQRKKEYDFVSTAGHLCSFAITTNESFANQGTGRELNKKKLVKLQNDLDKLLQRISGDGYKNCKELVKKKHLEKVKQLKLEINNIRGMSI